jgi:hypothetical protein
MSCGSRDGTCSFAKQDAFEIPAEESTPRTTKTKTNQTIVGKNPYRGNVDVEFHKVRRKSGTFGK